MKQFISSKLFFTLQKVSKSGIDVDDNNLKDGYDEFVDLLFSESNTSTDKTTLHNTLVYSLVELHSLAKVSKKNAISYLEKDIKLLDRQIEWIEKQMGGAVKSMLIPQRYPKLI